MDSGHTEDQPRTVTPAQIIECARRYSGVRWVHQGRGRGGVDCVGLILCVMTDLELAIPEDVRSNYGRAPTGELLQIVAQHCERIDADAPGALLLVRWPGEQTPSHAGIRTDLGMIHAYRNHSGVREHGYRGKWPQWTDSAWRLPGVIDG